MLSKKSLASPSEREIEREREREKEQIYDQSDLILSFIERFSHKCSKALIRVCVLNKIKPKKEFTSSSLA